jgi:hypothetical protein
VVGAQPIETGRREMADLHRNGRVEMTEPSLDFDAVCIVITSKWRMNRVRSWLDVELVKLVE